MKTPESLVDTWPLKRLIAKEVTPELLAQVAEAHKAGRRLFVATTNLDAQRGVVWNMGAIAAKGDEAALKLFRDVLAGLDRHSRPVSARDDRRRGQRQEDAGNARRWRARRRRFSSRPNRCSTRRARPRLPATELYLIANNRLTPEFQMTERSLIFVLGNAIAVGVQSMLRMNIDRAYGAAKRNGIPFYLSYPALAADQQGKGAFDTEFMKGLFEQGVARGKSGQPFVQEVGEALRGPLAAGK